MAFKLCVIGCGDIARRCHGPSYKKYQMENPDFELTACCDIDSQRAAAFEKKFGFLRYYTDFKEMLQKENPDAVCLLISEGHIAEVGVEIMNMGFPLFSEKPPGKNSAETQTLIDTAEKTGVIHQVGYNRRGIPILQKLQEMMAEPIAKKELQYIRYDLYRVGRFDEDFSDTAVHGIDAVRYLTGADYEKVRFSYQALPEFGKNVKNIYMDCLMTSGVHAQLCFCTVSGVVLERVTAHAKDNTWMANIPIWENGYDLPGELTHIRDNHTHIRMSGFDLCESDELYITNGFYNENRMFFENVRKGIACRDTFRESMNTVLIKDCISLGRDGFNL